MPIARENVETDAAMSRLVNAEALMLIAKMMITLISTP